MQITDYPYIVFYLFLFVCFVAHLKKPSKYIAWAAFGATFCFAALRAPSVGADTLNYVRYLTGERSFYNYDARDLEFLFVLYRNIVDYCTNSRLVVMIINTIVTMFPLYLVVKRYSNNPPLSIIFFFAVNGMMVYFVGLRQVIGLAFVLLAFLYIWNGKLTRMKVPLVVLFIIISIFFHTYSIVVTAVFLLVTMIHVKTKSPLYIGAIGSFMLGAIADFFSVEKFFTTYLSFGFAATSRLDVYMSMTDTLGKTVPILVLIVFLTSVVMIRCLNYEKIDSPFMKIFIIGVMISNLFYPIPMLSRVATPFVIFGGIPVTWLFCRDYTIQNISRRTIVFIGFCISLMLFGKCIKDNMSCDTTSLDQMHPYKLFIQEYKGKN